MFKRLKIWWIRRRIEHLKEAVAYMERQIELDIRLINKHQEEIKRLNIQVALIMPANMMLEEWNASRRL